MPLVFPSTSFSPLWGLPSYPYSDYLIPRDWPRSPPTHALRAMAPHKCLSWPQLLGLPLSRLLASHPLLKLGKLFFADRSGRKGCRRALPAPLLLVSTCLVHVFHLYPSFNTNNLKGSDLTTSPVPRWRNRGSGRETDFPHNGNPRDVKS